MSEPDVPSYFRLSGVTRLLLEEIPNRGIKKMGMVCRVSGGREFSLELCVTVGSGTFRTAHTACLHWGPWMEEQGLFYTIV